MGRWAWSGLLGTGFVMGALVALVMTGSGCGGGGSAVAAHLDPGLVSMRYVPQVPMAARVGDVLLLGTLDGDLVVDPATGRCDGQLQAAFPDGTTIAVVMQDSVATIQTGGVTIVLPNDESDTIFIDGNPESRRQQARQFFDALQQQQQPSTLPPQNRWFAAYWLMRYSWAWYVNAYVERTRREGGRLRPPGLRWFQGMQCALSVPALGKILREQGCAAFEARCRLGETIMIGGIRVPCDWLLAVCVNGQYVGDERAADLWLLLA